MLCFGMRGTYDFPFQVLLKARHDQTETAVTDSSTELHMTRSGARNNRADWQSVTFPNGAERGLGQHP